MRRFFRILNLLMANPWTWRNPGTWESGDADRLRGFLASPTGIRLTLALRNASIESNASAVMNASAHANGCAHGVMIVIRYIENLSRPVAPQDDEPETADNGAAAALDHLAP